MRLSPVVFVLIVLLSGALGCEQSDVADLVEPATRPLDSSASKYESGSEPKHLTVNSVDDIAIQTGRTPKVPRDSGGYEFDRAEIREEVGQESILRERRPVALYFGDSDELVVKATPFETAALAKAFIDSIASQPMSARYVRRETVAGRSVLVWDMGTYGPPSTLQATKAETPDPGGTLTIGTSAVTWADGDVVYSVLSTAIDSSGLKSISESMY